MKNKIQRKEILLTSTDEMNGYKITETIGLVQGSTVQSKWFGKDLFAGLKQIVGGELKHYSQMLSEARSIALKRMISVAKQLDADGITGIRFCTSNIMQSASEILVYGTAVKIKKK